MYKENFQGMIWKIRDLVCVSVALFCVQCLLKFNMSAHIPQTVISYFYGIKDLNDYDYYFMKLLTS